MPTNKSLGQHWLKNPDVLADIADLADLTGDDVVLEIGPGLGTLTSRLLARAKSVVAVEFDKALADKLPGQFPGKNLTVINQDILKFDLSTLPKNYKVVANVPYYITSKIIQLLAESTNPPETIVLLVQKEVAERLSAKPGDYSILAISAQIYYEVTTDMVVPADMFTPPPKVDSQVVKLARRGQPLVDESSRANFFRLVKAGFSAKRKKLRSSLAGGLQLDKSEVENLLIQTDISPDARAEDLTINQWLTLLNAYAIIKG